MGNPLDPKRNHRISLPDAAVQTSAHRQSGPARSTDSGAFLGAQVQELLSQPGCAGLRYYKGRGKDGVDSMILVGVDDKGDDMTTGILLDFGFPCPPYCPDDNPLNS